MVMPLSPAAVVPLQNGLRDTSRNPFNNSRISHGTSRRCVSFAKRFPKVSGPGL